MDAILRSGFVSDVLQSSYYVFDRDQRFLLFSRLQQQSADLCEGPVYIVSVRTSGIIIVGMDEEGMIHVADFMDFVLSGKAAPFVVESEALDGRRTHGDVIRWFFRKADSGMLYPFH